MPSVRDGYHSQIFFVSPSFDYTSFIKQALAQIDSVSWRASRHYECECCSVNRVTQWWKMFAAEQRSTRVQSTPSESPMATLSLLLDIQQLHSLLGQQPRTTSQHPQTTSCQMEPIVNEMDQDSYEWSRSSYVQYAAKLSWINSFNHSISLRLLTSSCFGNFRSKSIKQNHRRIFGLVFILFLPSFHEFSNFACAHGYLWPFPAVWTWPRYLPGLMYRAHIVGLH